MVESESPGQRPAGEAQEQWLVRNVKGMRERLGLTQGDLAKRMNALGWANFHPTTVSRIEKGDRPVRVSEAHALAEALETDMGHMFDSDDLQMSVALAYRALRRIQESEVAVLTEVASWLGAQIQARKYLESHDESQVADASPELAAEYRSVIREMEAATAETVESFLTRIGNAPPIAEKGQDVKDRESDG